ncbi:MAG: zinc metalloprotease HtpX [Chitinispirillaceae bacterium]|nr:zinc metalloprotease HtpX [Chitinispirillaceae bacterium]
MNFLKTTVLLGALTGLLMLFGNLAAGQNGMLMALVFAGLMNFGAFWFSDKIVLAMYRAKPVSEQDAPVLYRIVKRLADKAGMPMPKVYIIPTDAPNAFATGRSPKHASVAATAGIMRTLSEEELEGVMAHELAHVQNRDTLTATIAATMAGAIAYLATMVRWGAILGGRGSDNRGGLIGSLAMAFIAPIAALLIQMAISRSREYAADESGARLCGRPLALAGALERLEASARQRPLIGANPAAASLFIVNPFQGQALLSLFSTHPPMEKRIAKLRELAREG